MHNADTQAAQVVAMVAQFRDDGEPPTGTAIVALVFDAISSLLITVFVIIRVWTRYYSAENAASVLSKLSVGGVRVRRGGGEEEVAEEAAAAKGGGPGGGAGRRGRRKRRGRDEVEGY